ncbi:External alternative NAD(P)H-ubiquinone oxidoreductase B4, mitochondrial [Cocos nucifera]|uniref:External alternative NAD(P)H-ubiquinone oxidoreductase B4, mitochondrial n=1 Tax=Cocos nucifera TaxID=13894 RepID=A0A8K0IBA5_COCNU|nr:External alternative NAD(P)H-ubiquinone oxidoreductase B4, mitochondrial [Cocos nucifera]
MSLSVSFFDRASQAFHRSPKFSKLLVIFAVGTGGIVAYADAKSGHVVESSEVSGKKKLVVLGTGWAGMSFLKNLDTSLYDVQVVSPRNYFAFTPLLPSVTCGTVESRSIIEPIRNIVKKEVEDAEKIRRSVMNCFEKASLPNLSEEEKKKNLHFVIVGGGPTGVEFAAVLHDFVSEDLSKLYPTCKDLVKISVIEAGEHILSMFDKRITKFAEEKFQRDGIEVKTNFKVVKVSDEAITMTNAATGEINVPYGMAVWSTGIGTRPLMMDFMKQVGQGNRRVLATDEWLRVHNCDGVYALGDCATISQRKVMEDVSEIFRIADKDHSGKLTLKEIKDVIDDICERYPQVELYMKSNQMKNFVDLLRDSEGNSLKESKELDIEEFKKALAHVDSQVKMLPATAQVAAQQGYYLAQCFNKMNICEEHPEGPLRIRGTGRHRFQSFRYKHLGQFAPLGGGQTAAQLPGDWISIGHSAQGLWYSVYARFVCTSGGY